MTSLLKLAAISQHSPPRYPAEPPFQANSPQPVKMTYKSKCSSFEQASIRVMIFHRSVAKCRQAVRSAFCDPAGGRGSRDTLPRTGRPNSITRSEEHTSELQSRFDLVCRLLLEKKKDRNCEQ